MLLCTKSHFIKSLSQTLDGYEGSGSLDERRQIGIDMRQRIHEYASDETGLNRGCMVFSWSGTEGTTESNTAHLDGICKLMVDGRGPQPGQRVVYVDGGFDLFSSGHIEFLRQVALKENAAGQQNGWYKGSGHTYPPAYLVAGIHDDLVINHWKGVNYPIMNIFERGLCVLQCRVRH